MQSQKERHIWHIQPPPSFQVRTVHDVYTSMLHIVLSNLCDSLHNISFWCILFFLIWSVQWKEALFQNIMRAQSLINNKPANQPTNQLTRAKHVFSWVFFQVGEVEVVPWSAWRFHQCLEMGVSGTTYTTPCKGFHGNGIYLPTFFHEWLIRSYGNRKKYLGDGSLVIMRCYFPPMFTLGVESTKRL